MILLFAGILGRRATPNLVEQLLIIAMALLGLVILTRKPALGIVILIPISFFVRWEVGTGTKIPLNATFLLVAALLSLWLLNMFVYQKEVRLVPSRINPPALLFITVTIISLIVGNLDLIPLATQRASLPAQLGGWMLYALSIGMLLLVGNQINDLGWLRTLTWVYLALGAVVLIDKIVPLYYRINIPSPKGSTGSVFWTFLIALAYGQLIINRKLNYKWRLLLGVLIVTTLYYGWFINREWVSGWLPPIIAIIVITWLRSWRWGLALTAVLGIFVVVRFPSLTAQVMTSSQQYSAESRVATWPIMIELIKASPILGLGPANYYYFTPLYSIWGWFVKFNSHNNYVDIIAQTGLLGLGLFIWLIIEITLLGFRLLKRVQDSFSLGYIYAALGGLAGILVSGFFADWYLPFLYNIGIPGFRASIFAWIFLGGLISLDRISRSQENKPA